MYTCEESACQFICRLIGALTLWSGRLSIISFLRIDPVFATNDSARQAMRLDSNAMIQCQHP